MAVLDDTLAEPCLGPAPRQAAEIAARAAAETPDPQPFVALDRNGLSRIELSVTGARCAGCIRKIEQGLLALPGVEDARLNLSTQRLSAVWRPDSQSARDIVRTVEALGYETRPFDPRKAAKLTDEEGKRLLRCMGVAGFASMNIMLLSVAVWAGFGEMGEGTRALMYGISGLIAIPASLFAGRPFFESAWRSLSKGRANMDVPISLAVFLTLGVSISETLLRGEHAYFDGVTMLLFLLLVGRYLDHALRQRARTAARDLLALQAAAATRLTADGAPVAVNAADIQPGDLVLIAAGERAAVDGVIEDGVSDVDRALVTGETAPAAVRPGDRLAAGVVNLTHPLRLRATATADGSTLAELARLIEAGEQRRASHIRWADKAAELYVPVVHTLAALTFGGWLFFGADWRVALMNAAAVLIITCPCALGLAAPAVQVVATGRLFKRGVFVKSGDALERLTQIDAVVLDKTGTLTLGRPHLVGVVDPAALAEAAVLARASRHPLARALTAAAPLGPIAAQVKEVPGMGVSGLVGGETAKLGRQTFVVGDVTQNAEADGGTELWFQRGAAAPVRFQFVDQLREDAADTIAAFTARGLSVELASGDRAGAVARAAKDAGIARFAGELSPTDKIARLSGLAARGQRVLMVGDGLNDAPALAAAHVSASPGAAMDATQAAADFVFQGARLSPLIEAIDVAKAAKSRVFENFWFSGVYNLVTIPLAVFGFVTPLIAALAMAGSSLVVTLNALRLQDGDNSGHGG